jgi:RHS repeat-associated protein
MPGRQATSGESYRYGYQGQFAEEDEDAGWVSFELRNYDARIARWTSIDPANQYYSPYEAMGNDPANMIDRDGAVASGPSDWVELTNGKFIYVQGNIDLAKAQENWGGVVAIHKGDFEHVNSKGATIEFFADGTRKIIPAPMLVAAAHTVLPESAANVVGNSLSSMGDSGGKLEATIGLTVGKAVEGASDRMWKYADNTTVNNATARIKVNDAIPFGKKLPHLGSIKAKPKTVSNLGRVAKIAGKGFFVLGVATSVYDIATGRENLAGRGSVDLIMTGVGFFGGPVGGAASLIYFGLVRDKIGKY